MTVNWFASFWLLGVFFVVAQVLDEIRAHKLRAESARLREEIDELRKDNEVLRADREYLANEVQRLEGDLVEVWKKVKAPAKRVRKAKV